MLKAGVAVVSSMQTCFDFFSEAQNQINVRFPTRFSSMTSTIARVEEGPFQEYYRLEGSIGAILVEAWPNPVELLKWRLFQEYRRYARVGWFSEIYKWENCKTLKAYWKKHVGRSEVRHSTLGGLTG